MTRGAIYITFDGGDDRVYPALERSIGSLRIHHPDIEISEHVIPRGSLLDKAKMLDLSPFDSTVFLDADTVVLGPLDHGFEKAEKHGLAMCICECPWARRFSGLSDMTYLQEWNTGVMFFTQEAAPVFEAWKANQAIDSSLRFIGNDGTVQTMPHNDQAAFAMAIEQTGFNPWTLPLNWNYRPIWQHTAFGPIVVWHDYAPVPESVLKWNSEQTAPDAVIQCGRLTR